MEPTGGTALVKGGSSAIGQETALRLAQKGFPVIAVVRGKDHG